MYVNLVGFGRHIADVDAMHMYRVRQQVDIFCCTGNRVGANLVPYSSIDGADIANVFL